MTAPGFTGSPLDRADRLRHDPQALAAVLASPEARLLALDGLVPRGDGDVLRWLPLSDAPADAPLALIGLEDGAARVVALADVAPDGVRPPALFRLFDTLPAAEAATYAAARGLLLWHARHRFCANCGTLTAMFRAGWGRLCPHCATEHFPRVDPVVIMLAQHGEGAAARVLVGRQPGFPPGRYSALAGFVEPGESVEEAVARELGEEAGMTVRDVRYVASQPWPFPSQLMIACLARADDDALAIDTTELEHAMWVDRAGIAAALAGAAHAPFLPPPPYAIAHTLLERWLAEPSSPPSSSRT